MRLSYNDYLRTATGHFAPVELNPQENTHLNLNDKVAVITGGASGLGRATAEMVINNGGKVAIFDLNEELGIQTANELGNDTNAYIVNVTDETSVADAIQSVIAHYGGLHINVNCAGIGGCDCALPRCRKMRQRTKTEKKVSL